MKWQKRGLVWAPDGTKPWARSHAMCPTPHLLNEDTLRVFVTTLDDKGRGHASFVDVSAHDPSKVLRVQDKSSLDPGIPGAFDDNGVMPLSIVRRGDDLLMYYSGFEICTNIRYRIFTGLAVSRDDGESFTRHSDAPVLDRVRSELYFRGGAFVRHDDENYRIWYVGGDSWIDIDGKQMPVYDLRHMESPDGETWVGNGAVSMAITGTDEHGFGRPWVRRLAENQYQLFYSIRRRSLRAYRMGYAESANGLDWIRKDDEMGLDVSPGSFDSDAIMYAAVISAHGKTYCFYNGNNFGEDGFALAELVE